MQSLWGRDRRQTNALQVSHNIKVFHFFNSFNRGILIISILEYFQRGKLRCKSQPAARLTHGETRSRHSKAGVRFHTGREPPFHKVFVGILLYHCFFVLYLHLRVSMFSIQKNAKIDTLCAR